MTQILPQGSRNSRQLLHMLTFLAQCCQSILLGKVIKYSFSYDYEIYLYQSRSLNSYEIQYFGGTLFHNADQHTWNDWLVLKILHIFHL